MNAWATGCCTSRYRRHPATTRPRWSSRPATCIGRTGACRSGSPRERPTGSNWCCPERLLRDVAVVLLHDAVLLLDRRVERVVRDPPLTVGDVEGQGDPGDTGEDQDVADRGQVDRVPG